MSCEIRWVDHPAMLVDGLTNWRAKMDLLVDLMRRGWTCIVGEEEILAAHKARSEAGHWPKR
eukprot:1463508-Pyramimonas_sp.AAC.1